MSNNKDNWTERCGSCFNPNLTVYQKEQLLNDDNDNVRSAAVYAFPLSKEQIDIYLKDPAERVRETVLQQNDITQEQLRFAFNDISANVRAAAVRHPNAPNDLFEKSHFDDFIVKWGAIKNENIPQSHKERFLADQDENIKKLAFNIFIKCSNALFSTKLKHNIYFKSKENNEY